MNYRKAPPANTDHEKEPGAPVPHQDGEGVPPHALPPGFPFSFLRQLSRTFYRRVTRVDEWLWSHTSFIIVPILNLLRALWKHPVIHWLQINLNHWLFNATTRWWDYVQWILAVGTWLHSRVLWWVIKFYKALLRVWLTWLLSALLIACLAALMDQGKETCTSMLSQGTSLHSGQQLSIPMELFRLGCATTCFAASGFKILFILLSLPLTLPLALPAALWKIRFILFKGVAWWIDKFTFLIEHLLKGWYFVTEKLIQDVMDASLWIWITIIFPLWRLAINIVLMLMAAMVAVFSMVSYAMAIVTGAILQVISLIIQILLTPVTWLAKGWQV